VEANDAPDATETLSLTKAKGSKEGNMMETVDGAWVYDRISRESGRKVGGSSEDIGNSQGLQAFISSVSSSLGQQSDSPDSSSSESMQ
jgi:hypothetical protein